MTTTSIEKLTVEASDNTCREPSATYADTTTTACNTNEIARCAKTVAFAQKYGRYSCNCREVVEDNRD